MNEPAIDLVNRGEVDPGLLLVAAHEYLEQMPPHTYSHHLIRDLVAEVERLRATND